MSDLSKAPLSELLASFAFSAKWLGSSAAHSEMHPMCAAEIDRRFPVAPVQAEAYSPEHDAAHLDRWLTVARDEADTLRAKLAEVERRLALSDAALAEQIANRTKAETERDAAVRRAESLVGTFTSRNAIAKICGALGLASADTYEEDADAIIAAIGKLRDEAKAARKACPVSREVLEVLDDEHERGKSVAMLARWALEVER